MKEGCTYWPSKRLWKCKDVGNFTLLITFLFNTDVNVKIHNGPHALVSRNKVSMYSFEMGSDSLDGGDQQLIACNQPHLLDKDILADFVGLARTKQPSLNTSKNVWRKLSRKQYEQEES